MESLYIVPTLLLFLNLFLRFVFYVFGLPFWILTFAWTGCEYGLPLNKYCYWILRVLCVCVL